MLRDYQFLKNSEIERLVNISDPATLTGLLTELKLRSPKKHAALINRISSLLVVQQGPKTNAPTKNTQCADLQMDRSQNVVDRKKVKSTAISGKFAEVSERVRNRRLTNAEKKGQRITGKTASGATVSKEPTQRRPERLILHEQKAYSDRQARILNERKKEERKRKQARDAQMEENERRNRQHQELHQLTDEIDENYEELAEYKRKMDNYHEVMGSLRDRIDSLYHRIEMTSGRHHGSSYSYKTSRVYIDGWYRDIERKKAEKASIASAMDAMRGKMDSVYARIEELKDSRRRLQDRLFIEPLPAISR